MMLKFLLAATAGLSVAGAAMAQTPPAAPAAPAVVTPPVIQAARIPPPVVAENVWHLDLSTGGRVSIQLRADVAPNHVERIKTLTRQGFYNGLVFHRVIEGFMAQGGDPLGTGEGESTLPDLAPEFNTLPHLRGAVAMARTQDPNSANSQFYIMLAPRFPLDRNYTVIGRVIAGMQYVDGINRGEPPANPSKIVRASIGSDNVPPLPAEELIAAGQFTPPPAPATPDAAAPLGIPSQPPR